MKLVIMRSHAQEMCEVMNERFVECVLTKEEEFHLLELLGMC